MTLTAVTQWYNVDYYLCKHTFLANNIKSQHAYVCIYNC